MNKTNNTIQEIRAKLSEVQESLIDSALENDTEVYSKDWNKLEDVLVLIDDLEDFLEEENE